MTRAAPAASGTDRAAAVRAAMRRLVAERGFHGASMSAVAREAGVATGTAYVHYPSKDELVLAAYREVKTELGAAAVDGLDRSAPPEDRFRAIWLGVHRHLAAHRERALFLLQVDSSPYRGRAHDGVPGGEDALAAEASAPDMAELLLPLPLEVVYELGLGPAVRLAAGVADLGDADLDAVADACWRAITRPAP